MANHGKISRIRPSEKGAILPVCSSSNVCFLPHAKRLIIGACDTNTNGMNMRMRCTNAQRCATFKRVIYRDNTSMRRLCVKSQACLFSSSEPRAWVLIPCIAWADSPFGLCHPPFPESFIDRMETGPPWMVDANQHSYSSQDVKNCKHTYTGTYRTTSCCRTVRASSSSTSLSFTRVCWDVVILVSSSISLFTNLNISKSIIQREPVKRGSER